MNEKRVFSVLVNNHFGVLTRVAGLFARRGYNIDSLTVGATEDPAYSRMTIVARGDLAVFEQVCKQLAKLIDVKHIEILTKEDAVIRQLMFIKVNTAGNDLAAIREVTELFRGKVVDVGEESITIEAIGDTTKLEGLQNKLSPFGIKEIVRTGISGIARGDHSLIDKKKRADQAILEGEING
ncbi:MAG: acetolactate synthase small subunit [Spirochaetales bacterium]|nr:acetolactate synthase small subunit [Spirochaetales bacterium]